jgi:hypothetical protein
MTQSEREMLMPFLLQLAQSRTVPGDLAANNMIQDALRNQPNASYLLVQRALSLECELGAARRRIMELEGKTLPPDASSPEQDFLKPENAEWGLTTDGTPPVTSSKILYDLLKQPAAPGKKDFESKVVSYIVSHMGRIWLFILALVVVVVLVKTQVL